MSKVYLGDSVYVDVEAGMVKLTTENNAPGDPSNTIYLEIPVMIALLDWWEQLIKERLTDDAEPKDS